MNRISRIFALVMMAMLCTCCGKIGDISVFQYKIKSIGMDSLRSAHGVVSLEVRNNGPKITITSVSGRVFQNGMPLGTFSTGSFDLPSQITQWVDIDGKVGIESNVSILSLISMVSSFDVKQFSISFTAEVKMGMVKTQIKRDNIPLSKFIKQ